MVHRFCASDACEQQGAPLGMNRGHSAPQPASKPRLILAFGFPLHQLCPHHVAICVQASKVLKLDLFVFEQFFPLIAVRHTHRANKPKLFLEGSECHYSAHPIYVFSRVKFSQR